MKQQSTRDLLKLEARRLFARRGFDGVSVRDIVLAAGQRNSGSLHYYFGTKEDLARELVADGAKLIDERRNRQLDILEKFARPPRLREIIEILVWPATGLAGNENEDKPDGEDTYIRFIAILQMSHRQLFLDALEGKWASGYQRCLAHLRHLLKHVDPEIVSQRLVFMSLYFRMAMCSREAALEHSGRAHPFWGADFTMQNLIDTIEAMLRPPPSRHTRDALQQHRKNNSSHTGSRSKYRKTRPHEHPEHLVD